METLMIVIVLTFTPLKGGQVAIEYEAKLGVKPNLQACQAVAKAFDESPTKGKKVIVLCAESKAQKSKEV